jgi:antitoxin component YwqK of YwqJK toxin-antitoxin module
MLLKYVFIVSLGLFLLSCNSSGPKATEEKNSFDSCTVAVPFENAKTAELMVDHGYTGELNNYWGDDKSKLDFKHIFKNGKIVKSIFYYENGKIQEEYEYKCGSLHGIQTKYYKDGSLAQKIPYRYGRLEGMGEEFTEKGRLKTQVLFKADSIISTKSFDSTRSETKY